MNRIRAWVVLASALLAPTWSPSSVTAQTVAAEGGVVFASDADGDWDIWVMNADGSDALNLTSDGEPEGGWQDAQPSWSPDGTRIVFTSDRETGGDTDIFVMLPDGSGITPVTDNEDADDNFPDWSPDSARIVFTSQLIPGGGDDRDIHVIGADGSNERSLTDAFEDQPGQFQWSDKDPDWSPVSNAIVFASARQVEGSPAGAYWRIVTMDPDGSDQSVVSNPNDPGGDPFPDDVPNFDEAPEWSPDGAWITFATHQQPEQRWDIQIVRADGTDQQYVVVDEAFEDMGPTWSPDGTEILFASNRGEDGEMAIHSVNVTALLGFERSQAAPISAAGSVAGASAAPVHVADPDQFGRLRCTIRGTAGADDLTGTAVRDVICAAAGDDMIRSLGGRDVVYGAGGSDVLRGGSGDDILYGRARSDALRGGLGTDSCVDVPRTRRSDCEH